MSINSPVCAGLGGTGGDISFPLSDVFLASFPLSRLQLLGVVFTADNAKINLMQKLTQAAPLLAVTFKLSYLPFSARVQICRVKMLNNCNRMPEKLSWLHHHLKGSSVKPVSLLLCLTYASGPWVSLRLYSSLDHQ